jgi:thioredoxin reductase (NADPH)
VPDRARAQAAVLTGDRDAERFPVLDGEMIARLRRFGTPRNYELGETLTRAGEAGHGLILILSGAVTITEPAGLVDGDVIVTYGPGGFIGELAQISGQAALVAARAATPVAALVVPPVRLRALLVEEAELGERIMRALILRRVLLLDLGIGGPVIVSLPDDPKGARLENFLARNAHPFRRLNSIEDPVAGDLIARFAPGPEDLPLVLCPDGEVLRAPEVDELARCLGLVEALDAERLYDVAVVGAGPAGLATAVYAASEGLSVLALDAQAFGGQAGASARIENYLGFPTGISGIALAARAHHQARKFGAQMAIPDEVTSLSLDAEGLFGLGLANGERVKARSIVLACGARYRRLEAEGLTAVEAGCVHYWASPIEARLCAGRDVVLVGGGNSAGQAVVYLAGYAAKVWLLVRGVGLAESMSRYLADRIAALPNVEIIMQAEVAELTGEGGALTHVAWRDRRSGDVTRTPASHLFLFIGAEPNTAWLGGSGVKLDSRGFVIAGSGAGARLHPMETSLRGVFAIGDVRAGSVKRVAAAVGEGAQVVARLHVFLSNSAPANGVHAAPRANH